MQEENLIDMLFASSAPASLPSVQTFDLRADLLALNEQSKEHEKKNKIKDPQDDEQNEKIARTIFIGNLPVACSSEKSSQKKLLALFSECGKIDSIRFRSIAFSKPIYRKTAFKNKLFHEDRHSLNAYIVFVEEASVDLALKKNGCQFMERHLRVDKAGSESKFDRKRTVFVGNLTFSVDDEDLWKHFSATGNISNVRVIRDKVTNIGKGFALVEFEDRVSVGLAIQLNGSVLNERAIRVTKYTENANESKEKGLHKNSKDRKRSFEKNDNQRNKKIQKMKENEQVVGKNGKKTENVMIPAKNEKFKERNMNPKSEFKNKHENEKIVGKNPGKKPEKVKPPTNESDQKFKVKNDKMPKDKYMKPKNEFQKQPEKVKIPTNEIEFKVKNAKIESTEKSKDKSTRVEKTPNFGMKSQLEKQPQIVQKVKIVKEDASTKKNDNNTPSNGKKRSSNFESKSNIKKKKEKTK